MIKNPLIALSASALLWSFTATGQVIFFDGFEAQPTPTFTVIKLNDTGITWGGNYPSGSNSTCTGAVIAAQDCSHGRDASTALNAPNNGHAGFDFTKLDNNGNPLPASATNHACVRDNVTGFTWEVKTTSGLHNARDQYTWYNDNSNGGGAGDKGERATCHDYTAGNSASYCNTKNYVARVNQAGLCGEKDWRLPKVEELRSLVHYGKTDSAIDSDYFPLTVSRFYWSSSPAAGNTNYAWGVDFGYGFDGSSYKYVSRYVRLVRGGQ